MSNQNKLPTVSVCYHNGVFTLPTHHVEHLGKHPTRLASTPGDNIAEYAGKTCYDSCSKDPPGRPSTEYHANILATKHHSVYAHAVETFEITYVDAVPDNMGRMLWDVTDALHCRPGVWVTRIGHHVMRFAVSLRAVIEWADHGPEMGPYLDWIEGVDPTDDKDGDRLYTHLIEILKPLYPLALSTAKAPTARPFRSEIMRVARVTPELPKEQWCSLYIAGVSRDLLGEMVRHHWQANPSVRSTRYCDESNSEQIVHPALSADLNANTQPLRDAARAMYVYIYSTLTGQGVDKKTARGAARSVLPGATETQMVFSLSKFQARHLLALRLDQSTGSVDPEIGRLAPLMRDALKTVWPDL